MSTIKDIAFASIKERTNKRTGISELEIMKGLRLRMANVRDIRRKNDAPEFILDRRKTKTIPVIKKT